MRVAFWISKTIRPQAHACARGPTPSRIRMYSPTRARVQTQKNVIIAAFSRQQWFQERASLLRNMYIACIVEVSVVKLPCANLK